MARFYFQQQKELSTFSILCIYLFIFKTLLKLVQTISDKIFECLCNQCCAWRQGHLTVFVLYFLSVLSGILSVLLTTGLLYEFTLNNCDFSDSLILRKRRKKQKTVNNITGTICCIFFLWRHIWNRRSYKVNKGKGKMFL